MQMKLSINEWNLMMIYIKDRCKVNEGICKKYKNKISKLARNLERKKITETRMTKTLEMYPDIIFFEDLISKISELENSVELNSTDTYEMNNCIKVVIFNFNAYALDYFQSNESKQILKDFMSYGRPFWHSKHLYEDYYSNKLMYHELLKNKRYLLKVIMLRKNFEMRLKITKKLVKKIAFINCNSQTLTESLMDEIVYGG